MQRRVLFVLFGTLLIDMIGFGMVFPIIPILFTDSSSPSFLLGGYSPSVQFFLAGAITALWGLMQFIAAPLLGELSDAYGRKKLLLFGDFANWWAISCGLAIILPSTDVCRDMHQVGMIAARIVSVKYTLEGRCVS